MTFVLAAAAVLLAQAGNMSGDVQAASCQGHLLAAWREGDAVVAAVDGRKVTVSEATRGTPAVACGRASWLVVWPSDNFGVDSRRVAFDGSLLPPVALFRGPFGAAEVAASYGLDQFLVAWADGVTIRTLRVGDAGTALETQPRAVNLSGIFVAPRIAWTGSAFFLGWAEDRINPLSPKTTRIWGTRVSASAIDPVSLPLIEAGAGLRGLQPSMTAENERITFAWVAEHGAQTCVDVARVGTLPKSVRCSDDRSTPVLDEAEIRYSRGELLLVWRELTRDFASELYTMRLDDDIPTLLAERAWGVGLTTTSAGLGVAYFAAFAPPNEASVGTFMRVIEQDAPPTRRRAVR